MIIKKTEAYVHMRCPYDGYELISIANECDMPNDTLTDLIAASAEAVLLACPRGLENDEATIRQKGLAARVVCRAYLRGYRAARRTAKEDPAIIRQKQTDMAVPRWRQAHNMKVSGKSYKQIGAELGVSPTRASQLCKMYQRHQGERLPAGNATPAVFRAAAAQS
jgi:hypothetical protein